MARTVSASDRALITLAEAVLAISKNDSITLDDTMNDNIQRIINYVSELFESRTGRKFIKKNITEYWDGGSDAFRLRYCPVWANAASSVVLLGDDEYDVVEGDTTFAITDTDDNSAVSTDDYTVDNDSGMVYFDYELSLDRRRYKIEYTTGYWADTTEVSELFKQNVIDAMLYFYDSNVALWTKESNGVAVYPRNLPINVEMFLESQSMDRT